MTVQALAILNQQRYGGGDAYGQSRQCAGRQTFDEARSIPRVCACGRHLVTGEWSRLYCPWAEPCRVGRWGVIWHQAETQAGGE